jgi:hypothetical protein
MTSRFTPSGIHYLIFYFRLFSYASMRSNSRVELYEKIADNIFLIGLFLLSIGAIMVAFEAM